MSCAIMRKRNDPPFPVEQNNTRIAPPRRIAKDGRIRRVLSRSVKIEFTLGVYSFPAR